MLKRIVILTSLAFFGLASEDKYYTSTCSNGDTDWNREMVTAHLRYWLRSIKVAKDQELTSSISVKWAKSIPNYKQQEEEDRLDFVGNGEFGWKAFGHAGRRFHDGFLYGRPVDKVNGIFTGNKVVFVFPDFETVLVGRFENNTMIGAKTARIKAERCLNGIKRLQVTRPKPQSPVYKYSRPNRLRAGDKPLLADPFELRSIYIGSGIVQDGVFARRHIKEGDLVAYYGGLIYDPIKDPVFFNNMTQSDRYAIHRNLMSLTYNPNIQINIPESMWNTTKYRATLGHKLNHSFTRRQTDYNWVVHPRFGLIRSVMAIKDIAPDEELFVHYRYPVKAESRVPKWYKDLYEVEVGPWPKLKPGQVDPGTIGG